MKSDSDLNWIELRELIEAHKTKCGNPDAEVYGVDINKQFIPTRAVLDGVDVSKYYNVPPHHFACNLMHIGRDIRIPIAYNDSENTYVVTSAYYIFRVKPSKKESVLDEYIYMCLNSSEKDRMTWFYTDGSVRGNLPESRLLDITIPIPTIEKQRAVVEAWKSLKKIKEENEALAAPLMKLCQSYIQECKHKYQRCPIGKYMSKGRKNSDGKINAVLGVGQSGFIPPQKIPNESLKNYKVMEKNAICYAPPLYNIKSDAIHLYTDDSPSVCSPIYEVFYVDDSVILPRYLMMWLKRDEFKRYAEFYALGVRNTFNYELMEEFSIPLPSIDVQRSIVSLYECALNYQSIAKNADMLSRSICPSLLQYVINC